MSKKWLSWLLIVIMGLTLCTLSAAEDADGDEEVSLDIFKTPAPATPIPDATPEPPEDTTLPRYEIDGSILLTMTFTGDLTIGSNTQSSGTSIFEKELKKQKGDINFPFRNVRDILMADDLTMVNFEGTLTTSGKNQSKLDNSFLFRADPAYVSMLPDNGVETVSLENNHVLDMGEDGLAETKKTLLSANVTYASEGEPAVMTVRGVKIGSLAYQTFGGRHDELIARLPGDIQALRDLGCEIVIISFHWGDELDYAPNDNQVRLGRSAIDAGADLVIGHHSHRINPIEYYNGRYICYSLGNFSFAGNTKPKDMSTYLFQVKMRVKEGVTTSEEFKIIPCRISSNRDYNDFAPTPFDRQENIEAVLSTLRSNGKKLTYVVTEYPLKWTTEE